MMRNWNLCVKQYSVTLTTFLLQHLILTSSLNWSLKRDRLSSFSQIVSDKVWISAFRFAVSFFDVFETTMAFSYHARVSVVIKETTVNACALWSHMQMWIRCAPRSIFLLVLEFSCADQNISPDYAFAVYWEMQQQFLFEVEAVHEVNLAHGKSDLDPPFWIIICQ